MSCRVGRPTVPVQLQRRFWRLIRDEGASIEAAAVAVGVGVMTGRRWFAHAGGVIPSLVDEPSGYRLSLSEREEIAVRHAAGDSNAQIARQLGRHPSTIGRELSARANRQGRYRALAAQADAERKARRPKPGKLAVNGRLREQVQNRLTLRHSPQQIARRLVVEFPDEPEMRVSHETIYQSLYVQGRGQLRRELSTALRTGRAIRKPRRHGEQRRPRILDKVMISERPAEVDDRAVPGHWEGDLIIGANSASAIGTLVERATRFVMLLHLPADHGALAVQQAMTAAMTELPDMLRRSLTWDQGIEMAHHAQIALATGLNIYFCDPHSPWQRGTNENTNGLLRQYFPKGTDLSVHGAGYLEFVATELNNRPRKTLDWRTPAEALNQLLQSPPPPTVALTP
jgi:transposase, IS30 family